MDPNEALRKLLIWANGPSTEVNEEEAAELFLGLHEWLVGGGSFPSKWVNENRLQFKDDI